MTKSFKDFIESKFVRLSNVGDSIELIVTKSPFELEPRESKYKTKDGGVKYNFDYEFEDDDGNERIFSNGGRGFAQKMARTQVGDRVRITKSMYNGLPAYDIEVIEQAGSNNADVEQPTTQRAAKGNAPF